MNPSWKSNLAARLTPTEDRNTKAIVLVDTLSSSPKAILFDRVRDLLAYLGFKQNSLGSTSIVKRYRNPIKLYKNRYGFIILTILKEK